MTLDDFYSDIGAQAKLSDDTVVDPDTGIPEVKPQPAMTAAKAELSQAEAAAQTKRLMQARDMIQCRILAFAARDPDRWKEFKLSQFEFDWLCEVYADTLQRLGHVPAWLDILIAECCVMGPKIAEVFKYRKLAAENEALRAEIQTLKTNSAGTSNSTAGRRDTQRAWKVDGDGYFEYNETGSKYIKVGSRKIKPLLTPENYEMLVKHNGKQYIDNIFNTGGDA